MSALHSIVALGVILLFGSSLLANKIALTHSPPLFFTVLRAVIVLMLLSRFLRIRQLSPRLLITAFFMGANFTLIFVALHLSEGLASVAILIQLFSPFAALLGTLVLGEALGARRATGIVLAFAGTLILSFDPSVFNHPGSMIAVILAALAQAVASLFMRGLRNVHPFQMQVWIGVVSIPFLVVLTAVLETGQTAIITNLPIEVILPVIYTALAGSILAHSGLFFLIQRYPLALATSITLLVPFVAIALSVLFLNETLTWRIITGGIITVAGVAVIQLRRPSTREAEAG